MIDTRELVKEIGLGNCVSRGAVVAIEKGKHDILIVKRSITATIEPGTQSLPGGKFEDVDLARGRFQVKGKTDVNPATVAVISRAALVRELSEELDLNILTATQLGCFENAGWFSYLFLTILPQKPELKVQRTKDGRREIEDATWQNLSTAKKT